MDEETAKKIENLEEQNKELLEGVSDKHLTPNQELKKGVVEDLFDTVLGNDK